MKGLKTLAKLRAYSRGCGCVIAMVSAAALGTATPAAAYVPSAVDQYTERPPGNAGGPAGKGGGDQANGDSNGPAAGGGGPLLPTTGSGAAPGGTRPAGDGTTAGSAEMPATTPGEPTAKTLPVGDYPMTTLLWLALLAIVAAALTRLGIAARKRYSGTIAR